MIKRCSTLSLVLHDKIKSGNGIYYHVVWVVTSNSQRNIDLLPNSPICISMAGSRKTYWSDTKQNLNLVSEQDKALAVTLRVLQGQRGKPSGSWMMVQTQSSLGRCISIDQSIAFIPRQVQLIKATASIIAQFNIESLQQFQVWKAPAFRSIKVGNKWRCTRHVTVQKIC